MARFESFTCRAESLTLRLNNLPPDRVVVAILPMYGVNPGEQLMYLVVHEEEMDLPV